MYIYIYMDNMSERNIYKYIYTLYIYVTNHAKMRRFSKIMVVCFIAYLDRADSHGSNDTSMLLIFESFFIFFIFYLFLQLI